MLTGTIQAIELDLIFPSGHEKKYAALLGMGHNNNAIAPFETMLLKMSDSSDPEICGEDSDIILIFFHWYLLVERAHRYVQNG